MNEKESIERESFVFYRSFYEAIKKIDGLKKEFNLTDDMINRYKISVFDAICEYALNNRELTIDSIANIIFASIKPQIDVNTKRYKNGSKGGRPKADNKPKENQSKTKHKPNVNDNVNDNVNENIYVHWFNAFWELYPRKVNKKKSKEKFLKVCKDENTYNSIMHGLKKQIKSVEWQKDGGQYVPHPTTWLNGERWLDEVDELHSYDSKNNNMTAIADEIFGDEDE